MFKLNFRRCEAEQEFRSSLFKGLRFPKGGRATAGNTRLSVSVTKVTAAYLIFFTKTSLCSAVAYD